MPKLSVRPALALLAAAALSAGCAAPDASQGTFDPYETENRAIHERSKQADTAFLRPVSNAYGTVLPEPVRASVSNFSSNLSLPGSVVNDLLQVHLEDAAHNTLRFMFNTVFGIGGLFDPATDAGIEARDSDFGETLYVWGFQEGYYMELPLLGPSTQRDAAGKIVDLFLDPISYVVPTPERYAKTATGVGARLNDRYRFGDTIDSVLYESADSYVQTRSLYLQNRRFQLGQDVTVEDADPFAIDTEGF